MKNFVYALGFAVLTVLVVLSVLTIDSRRVRTDALETTLDSVMQTSMEEYFIKQAYPIHGDNEFKADFFGAFLSQIESSGDIEISICELDLTKGVFTVEVTQRYRQPNGFMGAVTCKKTKFLDHPNM